MGGQIYNPEPAEGLLRTQLVEFRPFYMIPDKPNKTSQRGWFFYAQKEKTMLNWIKNGKNSMENGVTNFSRDVRAKDIRAVYYLITFISSFSVSTVSATYVLFLLSQGLDLLQVNLVNLAFMTGNFIFEIPTGAYADYFGRKKSVILSNIFIVIAFTTYFFSSSIVMFILAEVLAALAYTFESGALDAWLVDSLEQKNYVGKVDYIFSHAGIVGQVAALLGGYMFIYDVW